MTDESDLATQNILNAIDKIQHQVVGNYSDAFTLLLKSIYLSAIGSIIYGIVLLLTSGLLFLFCRKFFKKIKDPLCYDDTFEELCFGVSAIFLVITFIAGCCYITDIWNYVAIFNPKLALAHQILEKIA